jgi:hypothetical protein
MNKEQFIYWLKGFAKAVNEEGPTPGQWGIIASELGKIQDCPDFGSPIDLSNPFPRWQEPHYVNPYKAGKTDTKVTYGSGTTSGSGVIVTDGFIQNLSVTRAQPPFTLTTTSTAYGHISGSTVSYTANQLELDLE